MSGVQIFVTGMQMLSIPPKSSGCHANSMSFHVCDTCNDKFALLLYINNIEAM